MKSRKKGVTGLDLAPELLFGMLLAIVSRPVKIEKQLTNLLWVISNLETFFV